MRKVLEVVGFPYWAPNKIITLIGVVLQAIFATVAIRQTFGGTEMLHSEPFAKPVALAVIAVCGALYALDYACYRNPRWRAVLDKLAPENE